MEGLPEGDPQMQNSSLAIKSLDDISRISKIFVGSGMFKTDGRTTTAQQVYQAGVKIIAGKEFGIEPFAAMRGINIIKGNAEMSANLMAAKVKNHPKYEYRVKKWDRDGCVLEFYELPRPGAPRDEWELLGESSFDQEDAKTAGLAGSDNWRKFARNMYFARAISNGVRIYAPDIFYGAPVYVEGEISAEVKSFTTNDDPLDADEETAYIADEPVEAELVYTEADNSQPGHQSSSHDTVSEAVESKTTESTEASDDDDEALHPDSVVSDRLLERVKAVAKDLDYSSKWIAEAMVTIETNKQALATIKRLNREKQKREVEKDASE